MCETQIAENGVWQDDIASKHGKAAQNGWYRYETEFAVPVLNAKKEIDHYTIYGGTLLIRNDADGKSYLYDMIDLDEKKKVISSAPSTAQEQSGVFEPKPSDNDIAQSDEDVNTQNSVSGAKASERQNGKYFGKDIALEPGIAPVANDGGDAVPPAESDVGDIAPVRADANQAAIDDIAPVREDLDSEGGAGNDLQENIGRATISNNSVDSGEVLNNGRTKEETRADFERRNSAEGITVYEDKQTAYGYRPVQREYAQQNARQIQEELNLLGINGTIIDGVPYEVDMRVRLVQENAGSKQDNVLYYFTPEEVVSIKKWAPILLQVNGVRSPGLQRKCPLLVPHGSTARTCCQCKCVQSK